MLRKISLVFVVCLFSIKALSGAHAFTEKSGTISADETFPAGTYHVTGLLTVNSGVTLTIDANAVLKFNPSVQMTVNGTLDANGTDASNRVIFTSRDDDTVGETVTGSDGSPAAGDWRGILLNGVSTNQGIGQFDFCRLRYGGDTAGTADANVKFDQSDPGNFTNSISESSELYGVWVFVCSPTVTSSTFSSNTSHGLFANSTTSAAPTVTDNTFTSNGGFGAKMEGVTLTSYSGNTGSGNGTNGFGVQGSMTSNQTWSVGASSFPFVLTSTVTVSNGVTLTLPAGTFSREMAPR